ncbi:NAD(P)-binding protein [Aspergillus campestris IBT 28561]|uniref:NAD(P)-binding protein n=1 Tax=Aspergillus campestris (strain IBT 28561) TaxID=1392248 RepID=A0A2I1CU31_ASPC2|nr:NAD(P)-binding protein [Aspergillus campestris IBT 28561]PKY01119.1 NAD(P)-binding protein [Aspergillus campestris IBT 28561]
MQPPQSIAIAGASDVSKYLIEELLLTPNRPRITLLTRSLANRPWFTTNPHISIRVTEYTAPALQSVLDDVEATVLFSFLHSNDTGVYNTAHEAMYQACKASRTCRRFVPSDYGGDIERFPGLPRFYDATHRAFREKVLEGESGDDDHRMEWTVVNGGWFMDYFAQGSAVDPTALAYRELDDSQGSEVGTVPSFDPTRVRSYMKPLPGIWPLDLDTFSAVIPGTGDEPIGWTAARDVAKALVRLVQAPRGTWERHTYVVGEIGTWNRAVETVERFFGRRVQVSRNPESDIFAAVQDETLGPEKRAIAFMDEWNVMGASAVPIDRVLAQREKFFSDVEFRGVEVFLRDAFQGSHERMV